MSFQLRPANQWWRLQNHYKSLGMSNLFRDGKFGVAGWLAGLTQVDLARAAGYPPSVSDIGESKASQLSTVSSTRLVHMA
jgi:hypothetical protein